MRKKITVVGAGQVGTTVAQLTAYKNLGNVVMVDIVEGVPQGKALDIMEARPVDGYDVNLKGTNRYSDIKGSHVIIVTGGFIAMYGINLKHLN